MKEEETALRTKEVSPIYETYLDILLESKLNIVNSVGHCHWRGFSQSPGQHFREEKR